MHVELAHGHGVQVQLFVRLGLVGIVLIDEEEELAEAALLEEPHKGGAEGLVGGGRHLKDFPSLVDIGSVDGLELQVARHLGVEEHLGQVATGHDELGDEVDVVVAVGAEEGRGLPGLELFVEVGKIERGNLGAVVAVAVDVQDLHPFHAEQAGNHALLETSAHDDGIVLAIGEGLHALGKPVKGLDFNTKEMRTSGVSADEIKCRKAKKMTRFDPVAKSSANKNIISIGSYRNCSQSYINIPPPSWYERWRTSRVKVGGPDTLVRATLGPCFRKKIGDHHYIRLIPVCRGAIFRQCVNAPPPLQRNHPRGPSTLIRHCNGQSLSSAPNATATRERTGLLVSSSSAMVKDIGAI